MSEKQPKKKKTAGDVVLTVVRIPDDISITGYDNSLYAQRGSGITTIAHPQEKLGEMAAELILEKINGVPEEKESSW